MSVKVRLSVVPVAQTFGDVCETKPYDTEDISCLVTVTVEEDQINTPTCSPGAFIRQYIRLYRLSLYFNQF